MTKPKQDTQAAPNAAPPPQPPAQQPRQLWVQPANEGDLPFVNWVQDILEGQVQPQHPYEGREFARLLTLRAANEQTQQRLQAARQQVEQAGAQAREAEAQMLSVRGSIAERIETLRGLFADSQAGGEGAPDTAPMPSAQEILQQAAAATQAPAQPDDQGSQVPPASLPGLPPPDVAPKGEPDANPTVN